MMNAKLANKSIIPRIAEHKRDKQCGANRCIHGGEKIEEELEECEAHILRIAVTWDTAAQ